MKKSDYSLMEEQLEALLEGASYKDSVMANAAAFLFERLTDVSWVGFYVVRDSRLALGPFQGKVACYSIEKGKGVCGSAWKEKRSVVVADVHTFAGHIACDSASNSEAVIPLILDDEVYGVLDIDSVSFNRFKDELPQLEGLAKIIEKHLLKAK